VSAIAKSVDAALGRILVIIPTYNELEALPKILARVQSSVPSAEILIVDDNSPDGTGRIADQWVADHSGIHVLHRVGKAGLGAAYLAGFSWGLQQGFDVLVEMDADGSHQPEQLPELLAALDYSDLVLGSRWVQGGGTQNWSKNRELLSRGGNYYTKKMLGLDINDATGGYRAFKSSTLRALDLHEVASAGYCFQVDLAWRAKQRGFVVTEVPIMFVEREVGTSKMSRKIVTEALWKVTVWGIDRRFKMLKGALSKDREKNQ
jgi:dolichol-phosphate mannosyltransferase